MLAGNQLQALPDSMAACQALELLRVPANRFEALPGWLPSLPRLSWLAFAGNPFDDAPEAMAMDAQPTPSIEWRQLSLGQKLGEGASGVIHQADWRPPDGSLRPVAVKLFKGAVTSDGWPHSEMAACIAAGAHPGLIPVLGRVPNHPDATPGLVLELVDTSFRNLAGPPSLQSCTRDVYADDARWTPQTALRMAHGLASAVARLHARGILHGDLYGHNILWNGRGDALLGDFGAASFLPRDDAASSQAMQRIESRSFGCLVEELAERCEPVDAATQALLAEIRSRCLDDDPAARPLFDEIVAALSP
jgi:serine/threonine protein kinase